MHDVNYAVMLMAFGGPESVDLIEPFLAKIMRGRKPSLGQIEVIKARYNAIGGKSPLNEITGLQAAALQKSIREISGIPIEIFVGMRYWRPYIKDTLCEITERGYNNIIAVCMAPQKSDFTVGGYKREIKSAINDLEKKPDISLISDFYSNKNFQQAVANKIKDGLSAFSHGKTSVIFSAHSLPLNFMGPNDPYKDQIEKTVEGVLSITGTLNWEIGYQSKGFAPGEWLGPSVDSILENLPTKDVKNVLIVPIAFVSDHVETLYDIDIEYRKKAESLGLCFNRSTSLNDSPDFIEALRETVIDRINKK